MVFMDIQMPVMDGIEATKVIRDPASKVRNHQVPIIAMTAHAMKGDREVCLQSGMDDYISKPIEPQELLQVIEKYVLDGSKSAEDPDHNSASSSLNLNEQDAIQNKI